MDAVPEQTIRVNRSTLHGVRTSADLNSAKELKKKKKMIFSLLLIILYEMEWTEIKSQHPDQTLRSCNLRKTEKLRGIAL